MRGNTALVSQNMPRMFVRKVRSTTAGSISAKSEQGYCSAALLTRMSTCPPRNSAASASAAARGADVAQGFLGVVVLLLVQDHHVRAFLRETDGDGPAYAGIPAGDDGGLALQLP